MSLAAGQSCHKHRMPHRKVQPFALAHGVMYDTLVLAQYFSRCCHKIPLLQRSLELGADYIATGHYARIAQLENGRYVLRSSVTAKKDQTYLPPILSSLHNCKLIRLQDSTRNT